MDQQLYSNIKISTNAKRLAKKRDEEEEKNIKYLFEL